MAEARGPGQKQSQNQNKRIATVPDKARPGPKPDPAQEQVETCQNMPGGETVKSPSQSSFAQHLPV